MQTNWHQSGGHMVVGFLHIMRELFFCCPYVTGRLDNPRQIKDLFSQVREIPYGI